jgi:hypothetical protein
MPNDLSTQAKLAKIKRLHGEIWALTQTTLQKAVRIGELLCEIKCSLKHGEWLPWLRVNVPFQPAERQQLYAGYHERAKLQTVSNLTQDYRLLAKVAAQDEEPANPALPTHEDLAVDLYIQLREVERCLDRYPGQLPEAVEELLRLVRQWTITLSPQYRERMGEL